MYWRTWNKPVYQFFRRHVYSPLRSRGWSHMASSGIVFFLSAVLHELLVGVPTHNMIGRPPSPLPVSSLLNRLPN
jgi:diacylglycerol O-acyltransferase-1